MHGPLEEWNHHTPKLHKNTLFWVQSKGELSAIRSDSKKIVLVHIWRSVITCMRLRGPFSTGGKILNLASTGSHGRFLISDFEFRSFDGLVLHTSMVPSRRFQTCKRPYQLMRRGSSSGTAVQEILRPEGTRRGAEPPAQFTIFSTLKY